MSTKAFVRAGAALLLLAALACSETLAPKLERIQSQIANALICTINWTGAATEADNLWQNPNNWAPARLPNSSDNVCITADGKLATLFGDASVNSLTIGVPGSSTPATLHVRGNRFGSTGPSQPANLHVANGIDNSGVMQLDATGHGPGPVTINVNGGAIENRAGGRLLMLAKDFGLGSGLITHYVNGNVVNDGTIDIRMYAELRGHYTNRGTVIIAENPNVAWEGPNHIQLIGGSWRQDAGELRVDTRFWLNDATVRLNHGAITGTTSPMIYRGTLLIGNGSTATGTLTVREAVTFSGDVYPNQTLVIDGNRPSTTGFIINTDVTAAASFTNNGIIRLTGTGHAGGTAATLVVASNGSIVNVGRIESTVANAGARSIGANITNAPAGSILVQASTVFGQPGAVYRNEGSVQIDPGATLTVNNAAAFVQQSGTLAVGGAYNQTNGVFQIDGGTITGTPWLAGTLLGINNTAVPATLRLTHVTRFSGNIGAQQKLVVESIRPFSTGPGFQGELDVTGDGSNAGTIVLSTFGFSAGETTLRVSNGTLTSTGRIEAPLDQSGAARVLHGNIVNQGTIFSDGSTRIQGGTLKSIAPATVTGGGTLIVAPGASLMASGNVAAHFRNEGNVTIGDGPGLLAVSGSYFGIPGSSVAVQIGGSPSAPGMDFDRMTFTGPMTFGNGTLQVSAVGGQCIDGGKSFEVLQYSNPSGNFAAFAGLNLGDGRTVQPVLQSSNYLLNVTGPACPQPDATPPVIAPTVTGTLGLAGWYTSDVSVTWSVTDAESPVTSTAGCDAATLTTDHAGITYTCKATSAGGEATQSVTIKRDATAPVVNASREPAANVNGWNNTDVTATYSATDATSGLTVPSSLTQLFSAEGVNQTGSHLFTDNAGNSATASVTGISIDKTVPAISQEFSVPTLRAWYNIDVTVTLSATDALSGIDGEESVIRVFTTDGYHGASHTFTDRAGNFASNGFDGLLIDKTPPVVSVTRSPLPDATGWNDTDVTATWTATDALSGINGSSSATHLFDTDGANQSASRTFSDLAGNRASATISGINIDKTPAPPPTLSPACSVTPNEIWPANNKLVSVRVSVGGSGVTSYTLRSVTNNETGSADVSGWTLGTADVDGTVLAKRNGGGTGRTYTLTYDVFGANGATGSCAVTVRVPHDQRR